MRPRARPLALVLIGAFACASCDPADECVRRNQLRVGSPTGDAMALFYPGVCADADLAPQVALSSHGHGAIVLSEASSRRVMAVVWSAPTRLEITYRSANIYRPLSRTVVLGDRSFEVVYRSIPLNRVDRARMQTGGSAAARYRQGK